MIRRGTIFSKIVENNATVEKIVSGALFDFAGMLTTLEEPLTVSAKNNAAQVAELVDNFSKKRGLDITNALVEDWQKHLSTRVASLFLSGKRKLSEKEIEEQQARRSKKVNAIRTLAENITKLRHNISRDLKSENEKIRMTALAIALMDKTTERVGNDDSAENGHFGVTGFKKKHIIVDGNKVQLKYVGKSGVKQDKSFSDAKLADIIRECLKNCKPNDYLLQCLDGYKVNGDRVNRYLSDFGVTAKDIRGYGANRIMVESLKRKQCPKEEKDRKKVFLEVLRKVANDVGHGSQMLRTTYLLPNLESEWIKNGLVLSLNSQGH